MKAIILAAVYATRMYPLTRDRPKHLLEIADKKVVLDYAFDRIKELQEMDEIHIVTNEKFFTVFIKWVEKKQKELKIPIQLHNDETNHEDNRLGAIGDLHLVLEKVRINDDILVMAGDNLLTYSLKPMADLLRRRKSSVLTRTVDSEEDAKKRAVITVDRSNRILTCIEKPDKPHSRHVCAAIYMYQKEIIPFIKAYVKKHKNNQKLLDTPGRILQSLVEEMHEIYAHLPRDGVWFDIGSKKTYKNARKHFRKHFRR